MENYQNQNDPQNFQNQNFNNGNENFIPSQLPNATAVLVLGIISILGSCCFYGIVGLICGIIALVLAKKSTSLYKQNPNAYTNYSNVNTGRILAIIGIVLSLLIIIMIIFFVSVFGLETLSDQQLMQERIQEFFQQYQ